MKPGTYWASPARLLLLFVLLSGIPLTALAWLGWRMIEQDRILESQRLRERLENAANSAVQEFDRVLSRWEALIPPAIQGHQVSLPPKSSLFVFGPAGATEEEAPHLFSDAEAEEFRNANPAKAVDAYRKLAANKSPAIRAGALIRLARSLREQQDTNAALSAYAQLIELGATPAAGSPATLVGRHERIALFQAIGDKEAAKREADLLWTKLSDGSLVIDRTTFQFFSLGLGSGMAEAVEAMWPEWQRHKFGRTAWTKGRPAFVSVWQQTPDGIATIVAPLEALLTSTDGVISNLRIDLALDAADGQPIWGSTLRDRSTVTRAMRDIGLMWTVSVTANNREAANTAEAARRNLLFGGFLLMSAVIATASYFVFRAVTRELNVARLQSDFVSAVSHEFRTPLTAMCHLTEMLEEGGLPPDRVAQYYRAMGKESRRLQALVENLLDFGKIDSGRRTYSMEDLSAAEMTRAIVDEFRERTDTPQRIALHAADSGVLVRADRDSLALAIRNLLDNALKYSPEASAVHVSVEARDGMTGISVQDQGAGIPKEEQRDIFRKFVRGSASRTLNVKGAGIGLTMTYQIIRAHGGRLELKSNPERGSVFTILLPTLNNPQ